MREELGKPFGQPACEAELNNAASDYGKLYFGETLFNDEATRPHTYLIIGRRGSGKTALAQSFSFQKNSPGTIHLAADKPETYQQVLAEMANITSESRQFAIPQMRRIWEYILWSFMARVLEERSPRDARTGSHISQLISSLIDGSIVGGLLKTAPAPGMRLDERLQKILALADIDSIKSRVIKVAQKTPITVTLDTLEQYDVNNRALMYAMAALVAFAADFNLDYSGRGIHLKVFMSGEVMPHLEEEVLPNTLKDIRDPVYLFWRPKDLLRLICWRLYCYLEARKLLQYQSKQEIDWTDHHQVLERMWVPYFGEEVVNRRGITEQTFPYVLRHTQMRPRQLIVICNAIAQYSLRSGRFPVFSESDIRKGVQNAELTLASEIINSFSSLYPRVGGIVEALHQMPQVFKGNELDRRAQQSASDWPPGTYSASSFRRLVTELGIVGVIERNNPAAGFIDANFEYSVPHKLIITHRSDCVVHPMFYEKLSIGVNSESRVMPFSTDRDNE